MPKKGVCGSSNGFTGLNMTEQLIYKVYPHIISKGKGGPRENGILKQNWVWKEWEVSWKQFLRSSRHFKLTASAPLFLTLLKSSAELCCASDHVCLLATIFFVRAFAQEAGKVTGNAFLNQKLLQVRKGEGLLSWTRQYVSVTTHKLECLTGRAHVIREWFHPDIWWRWWWCCILQWFV